MKKALFPPALKKGDLIGVMAPSSRTERKAMESAKKFLESEGYRVKIHPQTFRTKGQAAGTGAEKAKALHALFADPAVSAVFAARGGNRAGTMLEHLDFDLIRKNPKILMGYSDITALLNAVYKQAGLVTFHGPVANSFARGLRYSDARQCFDILKGAETALPLNKFARILRKGKASGPLAGGNLSLLSSLLGTPYMPDMKGAILFLEDCTDEKSRFDRMFLHLRNAGVFNQIGGLVVGQFTDVTDTGRIPFGMAMEDIIREAVAGTAFPVVTGAPFGHGGRLATYPVGAMAKLDATGRQPALTLTSRAVK